MAKLLLIDDDKAVHELIRAQITAAGIENIEVISACDGIEGTSMYEEENPDIVVMDLRMPHRDGYEATRRIMHRHPDAKIIVLTSYPDTVVAAETFNSGASALVRKAGKFAAVIVAFIIAFMNGSALN
ncbi:response regulator [bacterium]|nr:response regulator [bacterium]